MVEYKVGDLFSAPEGALLAHSCNCKGVWGGGVAAQMAVRYPVYHKLYQDDCRRYGKELLGHATVMAGDKHLVGCLYTSNSYGPFVDPPDAIVRATETALQDLISITPADVEIHMPKINSGLFRVPWELTEAVLVKFDRKIIVWEPK